MTNKSSFAYPLRAGANGGLELATGDEITQDRIRSIIETRPLEMIMHPVYGLSEQAFTLLYQAGVIAERVRQALTVQLPSITPIVQTEELPDEGVVILRVSWQEKNGATPALQYRIAR